MSFSDFNLKEEFVTSIEAAGYLSPTPLQAELIPLIAKRESALISTQSVSGKTGAFLIPAINYILDNPAPEKRGARILILTSRRDRVSQINYTIKRLSSDHHMRFGFIVSGRPYQTQMRLMRRPLDIMIATPGRLNDLMNNGKADFSQLEMLILDDLSSIYHKNLQGLVESILKQTGDSCNSITFIQENDSEIKSYAQSLFPNAKQISFDEDDVNSEQAQEELREEKNINKQSNEPKASHIKQIDASQLMPQKVHIADDYTHKIAMMDHLMDEFSGEQTWVYTATNKAAKQLQDNLANHGHTAELIQDLNPEEFDECDILIVSDQEKLDLQAEVIAENDTHIVHFDLPRKTDLYLERLNRHNQEREEACLLMVDGYNYNELKHIEKTFGDKIEQILVPGLEPLKPFVNLSKPKPQNKHSKGRQNNNNKARHNNSSQSKGARNKNNTSKRKAGAGGQANSTDSKQRRQRKGPFGRLNGGANKKNSNNENNRNNNNSTPNGRRSNYRPKVGVSTRGTATPKSDRGWQSDFAEPKERKAESKNVVIRYSKKRTIPDKSEKSEDA